MKNKKIEISLNDIKGETDNKVFLIYIDKIVSNIEIPGYVDKGTEVAIISTSDFKGIIPKNEYSAYHNSFKKNSVHKILKAIIIDKFEINNETFVVFSPKSYELKERKPSLDELKSAEYVNATVIGFNEYSAILKYKNLKLQLSNYDFSNKGDVLASDILNINDQIMVKFSKMKKNDRVIKVLPIISFPNPDYLKKIDESKIKEGMILNGKVIKVTPKNILITIGKNKSNHKVITSAFHPLPYIDELVIDGSIVKLEITGFNGDFIYSKIIDLNNNMLDDNITTYQKALKGDK